MRRFLVTVAALPVLTCGVARADWRSDHGMFRVGVVVRGDRGGPAVDYKAAAEMMSKAIGMPVEIVPMLDYGALIEAQAASRIDYAVYSATAFGTIYASCECVTPLVAPVSESGDTSIVALLATTSDRVRSLDDLDDSKLAWTPDLPAPAEMAAINVEGVPLTGDEKFAVMSVTPQKAVDAIRRKKANTMFGWAYAGPDGKPRPDSGTLAALRAAEVEYSVVWTSQPVRFGPHAVRKNIPADIRDALREFLTNGIAATPEIAELLDETFHGRFQAVSEADYAAAVAHATAVQDAALKK